MVTTKTMTKLLSDISPGQTVRVRELPNGVFRTQLIRLGIYEGLLIECFERLPGGTMVVRRGRSQISIGRLLAESIRVSVEDYTTDD
ncbi:MAG TPA: FeoA family protein [Bacteroidota bacterium]|nr:FeoA family protein [Bacteroidota bacterium]